MFFIHVIQDREWRCAVGNTRISGFRVRGGISLLADENLGFLQYKGRNVRFLLDEISTHRHKFLQVLSSTETAVIALGKWYTVETWGFQQGEIRIVGFWAVTLSLVSGPCVFISHKLWSKMLRVETTRTSEMLATLSTSRRCRHRRPPRNLEIGPFHTCVFLNTVVEVVSRRLFIASAWVWSQIRLMQDLRTKWYWGTCYPSTSFSLPIFIPPNGQYSLISPSARLYGFDINGVVTQRRWEECWSSSTIYLLVLPSQ